MQAYLTMSVGPRAGTSFALAPNEDTLLGRGSECTISLTDPLCSRVHAVVLCEAGRWLVRDSASRNGTYVNDQKIDEAVLGEGHSLRIGTTEFEFHENSDPPTLGTGAIFELSQTLVTDARVRSPTAGIALGSLHDPQQAEDLLLLYQLSLRLLGTSDAQQVLRTSLELLKERTNASVAGFLWINDQGQLQPKLLIPETATSSAVLSESLTRLVCEEGHAIWIANQQTGAGPGLEHYADALCVPLMHSGHVAGAVHLYLERGRFRQSHFDFAISLANIAATALARARRETSIEVQFERLKSQSAATDELLGESRGMRDLKSKIARLGPATGSVLVRGESGTGKELVARALHRSSTRADRPMLSVNCAAIPIDLMESQLFGHKAGAFTGADRDHAGYFEQADLGTLFLDEIGELTLAGQAKLLRILEGHPFMPVGGTQELKVDVRVIAATNRELAEQVRDKKFREDLFYRLSVFELFLPPLRDRQGDVDLLVDYFLDHFRRQHGRPGLELAPAAREKLRAYNWPGNVRQLRNAIDSAVVLAAGSAIEPDDFGLRAALGDAFDTLSLVEWERRLIIEAMKRTGGNIPEAARLLELGRATLYRKLDALNLPK